MTEDQRDIAAECDALKAMLLEKNKNYGSSALAPLRVFARADTVEAIRVRIDDKLSRLARGNAGGEDSVWDLCGYLVLLRIAERRAKQAATAEDIRRVVEDGGAPLNWQECRPNLEPAENGRMVPRGATR